MWEVRTTLAILLALEALNAVLWSARILSAAAAYDGVVLTMVALRVLVSAVQAVSAWLLAGRALPALPLAKLSFVSSATLVVFEIGFRLSPSSVLPDLRWPLVIGYGFYALMAIGLLGWISRRER